MKILVTGASGFIGGHLARRLKDSDFDVVCLVRKTSDISFLKTLDVTLRYGNLEDETSLEEAVRDVDIIYHTAGLIKVRGCHYGDYYRVNVEGTRNLLEAIRSSNPGVKRLVFFSSQAAAGPSPYGSLIGEDEECRPVTHYGRSKLKAEELVREFCSAEGISFTVIRPPAVFGPRDYEVLYYFKEAKKGKLPVIGDPDNRFSLVYVRDLVDGSILAAGSEKAIGQTYFICYPEPATWRLMVDMISNITDIQCKIQKIPYPVAYIAGFAMDFFSCITGKATMISREKVYEISRPDWICSSLKITGELGFKPGSSLEEAMRTTAQWYQDKGWI
jgi:nucleoside-diphosphate-sugar epimerase